MKLVASLSWVIFFSWQLHAGQLETFCIVRELEEADVAARRDGQLVHLPVRRGYQVAQGQLVAELDNSELRIQLEVAEEEVELAKTNAANDGPLGVARAAVKRAEEEIRLLNELGDQAVYLERFRGKNRLERAKAELRAAENKLAQDRLHVAIKLSQATLLERRIAQTRVYTPFEGVVSECLKDVGEWVKQGEAVATITRMDKLLIEGFVDLHRIPPHRVKGTSVVARIQLGDREERIDGLVVNHSSPKLDLDGKYPVWIEVENRRTNEKSRDEQWLLRAGMTGTMIIQIPEIKP